MNFHYSKAKLDSLYRTRQIKNCLEAVPKAEMPDRAKNKEKPLYEA